MANTSSKVAFDKMTREAEEESTSDIRVDGRNVGYLQQEASFVKRSIMGSMEKKVCGYRVHLIDHVCDSEPTFKTLIEARDFARAWIKENLTLVTDSAIARDALRASLGKKAM